jgi:hypothetical protein
MLLRILIRLFLGWAIGDPDSVEQDETTWPTWLVALLMILVLAAPVGIYFYFRAIKS